MSGAVAKVHVERHKQRKGFGGTITVQNGLGACEYRLRIFNHPAFNDAAAVEGDADWSGFVLEITRGTRRCREIVVQRVGALSEDPQFDESGPMLEQAAQQILLQASAAGVQALTGMRRESLAQAVQRGVEPRALPRQVDVEFIIDSALWQQVTGNFDHLMRYLLAKDVLWQR